MQGSTRQEHFLDEVKRKEIADELSKLAKDAFSSLKNANLQRVNPVNTGKLLNKSLIPIILKTLRVTHVAEIHRYL